MTRRLFIFASLFLPSISPAQDQAPSIDLALAKRYFQEAKWASDDEGGRLWGKALYGPSIFVDYATGFAVANQPDASGKLKEIDGVWVGTLPSELPFSNTALNWSGTRWSMFVWQSVQAVPSEERLTIVPFLMHESFHRIQGDVGLPMPSSNPRNAHLDTKDGRVWLRLEYRALSRALSAAEPERRQSLTDALIFRSYRRSLFPGSAAEEDRLELHEGMCEYTGMICLGLGNSGARSYLAVRIKESEKKPTYPLSFAYETGPAYGLMLDMESKNWRKEIKPNSSLSETLKALNKISLPQDLKQAALASAAAYNGRRVFREEDDRENDRAATEKSYLNRLVSGPVLELPGGSGLSKSYNPDTVFPLGAEGTVYPISKVSGDWGVIEVKKGIRVTGDPQTAYVSVPTSADHLQGDGWKLRLEPGWEVAPGSRAGDFKVALKARH